VWDFAVGPLTGSGVLIAAGLLSVSGPATIAHLGLSPALVAGF
jgi:hypothetical protein